MVRIPFQRTSFVPSNNNIIIYGKLEEEIRNDPGNGNYWINAVALIDRVCKNLRANAIRPAAILNYDYEDAMNNIPTVEGPVPEDLRCKERIKFKRVVLRNIPLTELNITRCDGMAVRVLI